MLEVLLVQRTWLWDLLEAADADANRVGLEHRNRSPNDFSDEVVAGSCDPDVASLIDSK